MEKPKDFYRILGVARDASPATIRRAYKRLTRRLRPEGESAIPEELHLVQQAYETLSDDERRQRYDETLRPAAEPERDRFASLALSFLRSPAAGDLRRPVRPTSLSGDILLQPHEARAGGPLTLDVPARSTCPACRGTGGRAFTCGQCGGDGRVERRLPVALLLPRNVRDGTVFQVVVDEPDVREVLLTVHVAALRL